MAQIGKPSTNVAITEVGPRRVGRGALAVLAAAVLASAACGRGQRSAGATVEPAARPWILLVTLDTTRADAIGPEAEGVETPAFDALAARGRRFRQAYATAPETLPAHASLLSGLYPAGHGVHENARPLSAGQPLLAERLRQAGYRTAAFVSSFVLARRFGLARGFDVYDDALPPGQAERSSRETTQRALTHLASAGSQPLLLWVHYYDPHAPYHPPEPFKSRYPKSPYLGEVAAMDEQLGRLARAFEARAGGAVAIVVVGDHGEGLGEHGEAQHGRLLYQGTMRVPLLLVGPGVAPSLGEVPVSARRVCPTLLDWAGLDGADSLRRERAEPVLGEAMKPHLDYGWQPQVMAVDGAQKAILAGRLEAYDLAADPKEAHDLGEAAPLRREARAALRDYPLPAPRAPEAAGTLDAEQARQLATLGYVAAGAQPVVRKDAPRPVEMAGLFEVMDRASALFVAEDYARVVPLLEKILAADPHNLDAALRLATAHSALGHAAQALAAFERAGAIAPGSPDVRAYLALHYARGREWEKAAPLLERVLAETPDRLPALEALARVRERQGRPGDAARLWQRVHSLRAPSAGELGHLGELAMQAGRTAEALAAFEKARALQAAPFAHDLELGVLYLAERRLAESRDALDRVPRRHPGYPMALFKRAQVSVLLGEPDQAARIEAARRGADATTRELVARERLFGGASPR